MSNNSLQVSEPYKPFSGIPQRISAILYLPQKIQRHFGFPDDCILVLGETIVGHKVLTSQMVIRLELP